MTAPQHAIPPVRDRLQSRSLVVLAVPALCIEACQAAEYAAASGTPGLHYLAIAAAVSAVFALAAWQLRAATVAAAACGGLICFDLTVLTGRPGTPTVLSSALVPLILLFVLTHTATRFHRTRTPSTTAARQPPIRHGRNAAQVIANLAAAAIAAALCHLICGPMSHASLLESQVLTLAALAEATADTVSSEIGQAVGGVPRLLTTMRPVAHGTDGAITALGTASGVLGAAAIALCGMAALRLGPAQAVTVMVAGIAGLLFDSLLGATLERRGWIGNDVVNFASTVFAVAVAGLLHRCALA